MKHFTIVLTILLFSQMAQSQKNNASYETLWKQVQKLEREDLTKSAMVLVTTISQQAKKEQNTTQVVKALLYSSKYAMTLEEDAHLKIITDFKSEIEKAKSPTKNVLESYLAHLYWQFFQQNRYQFYNRTKTKEKIDPNDFRTWDLTTLFKEITMHFEASLENESELMKIPVSKFDLILNKQKGSSAYRPTLFDLLAHTALDFYKTNENNITRPSNKFEIDNPELLCDGATFASQNITTQDDTSLQAKALCIYQKLLRLHSSSDKVYTFAVVNIERLHFISQNATFENKEQQLLDVFQNAANASKGGLRSSLYQYEIADLLNRQGNTYQPKTKEEHRFKRKQALAICETVIKELPKSKGAEKCKALKSQILVSQLQLTAERNIPKNTTSRLLINYKNHSGLHLTARRITKREFNTLEELYPKEKILAFLKKLPIAKDWEAALKNESDYQLHSTEISIPPLENGQYIILAEPKDKAHKTFSYSPIQATDLALVETQSNTHKYFQVINRNNGKPIAGAKLTFQYRVNYNGPRMSKSLVADKTGTVTLVLTKQNWNNVNITVSKSNETAYFKDYYVNKRYDRNSPETSSSCFLFTDRSIYRPGQPLYFKGIAIKKEKEVSSLLKNTKVSIQIRDVNEQVLITQEFTTSDYGSFAGEYILPNNGLTGQFSIKVFSNEVNINGYASFSAEEYKRPKFETSFEAVTETYKVNDSVTIKGSATAYAGSKITDAKVTYRVKRVVYYPKWYYWYHSYSTATPQEITHGETTSDASGNYEINFKALPDNSIDKKNLPTFSYEVSADVTDINGETHSTTSVVTVGYHTMTANMNIPNPFNKNTKDNKLSISTNNLNGQFVPAQGTVKIYKLKAPNTVLRPRTWDAPDYTGFSMEKFKELYPHDAFDTEHNASTWKKGKLVWQANFDTEKSKEIILNNTKNWDSGKYLIELETQDKFGQPVKDILQTTLFSQNDKKLADNQLFQIKTDKESYVTGEKVKVTLLSAAEDLNVTVYIEKDHMVIDTHIFRLNNDSKSFTIPVTTNDLGGFAITYSYAVYNSFHAGSLNIRVPYPSTGLEIETLTFRDKLQPGTDETWSFKIKGTKGDKVSAELLASMYDASLDAFQGHSWNFNPLVKPTYYSNRMANAYQCFSTTAFNTYQNYKTYNYTRQHFDSFNWFGLQFGYGRRLSKNKGYHYLGILNRTNAPVDMEDSNIEFNENALESNLVESLSAPPADLSSGIGNDSLQELKKEKDGATNKNSSKTSSGEVQIRKNLEETAFFFPQLHTDKEGNVSFNFTTPEALTKWNLQLLSHTKNLESSIKRLQTVTQKELMVIPNAPRFLREGDEITISTKIVNLSSKRLKGLARLSLTDGLTGDNIFPFIGKPGINYTLMSHLTDKEFKVDSMGNTQVSWRLKIPEGLQAVQYKVIAKAGDFSDGEQNVLPVLTNRKLVTETLPMWVRSNETKTFVLNKLKTTSSTTLEHHKLTLEMTSNPAWYAVQALPYLMEYPYECNEQTFSKYYANTLASHIANSNPRIQEVFQQWANADVLISNLEKNQELKSILIQETPWLRDAQSETEQKKRIGLLFNLNKMKSEQTIALNKLKQSQKSSGAWAWFIGGHENRYITQHILTGFGHLKQLNVTSATLNNQKDMIQKAISYLDHEFVKEYQNMKKYAKNLNDDHLSQTQIHYLYMRSFFKDVKNSKKVDEITGYYKKQAQKHWTNKGLYSKGMLALIMHRMEDVKTANKILRALKENSITSEELGMYWKVNTNSWYWYQAPIETQSLLIEAFSEIHPNDIETVDNLKIWLLKNKQTNQWKTTKATTEAVHALLLQGSNWLSVTDAVDVLVGGEKIEPSKIENVKIEAGTGYYKTTWNGKQIKNQMSKVQIRKKGEGIAWGALYWQYFEDLDKITSADTPLKLKKKLFLKKNTNNGEEISKITSKTNLKVGDLVRVRIELRADRPMEFVHMKDMRAAGFEPINVLSQYKWQDGIGYYESTKDASTNFFFDHLPKGVYIFEYDLRVNNSGNFSNGITTIQSMYAPEFSSHSKGIRVQVKE